MPANPGLGDGPIHLFVPLTAMTELEHAVTAMTAGADDFMVKPLDRSRLQAAPSLLVASLFSTTSCVTSERRSFG